MVHLQHIFTIVLTKLKANETKEILTQFPVSAVQYNNVRATGDQGNGDRCHGPGHRSNCHGEGHPERYGDRLRRKLHAQGRAWPYAGVLVHRLSDPGAARQGRHEGRDERRCPVAERSGGDGLSGAAQGRPDRFSRRCRDQGLQGQHHRPDGLAAGQGARHDHHHQRLAVCRCCRVHPWYRFDGRLQHRSPLHCRWCAL